MATYRSPFGSGPRALVGYDAAVTQWVSERLGCSFGPCSAVGFVIDGKIMCGLVYSNYTGHDIHISIASESKRWCTKNSLRQIFSYPFHHLGCRRVTVLVDAKNQPVRAFVERLGFIQEGLLREGHPNDDAAVYGMLQHECRWIDGQEKRTESAKPVHDRASAA